MHIFPVIILAIIQGVTEFLPISSSAHLLITAEMMNLSENLSLDISLHLGTLLAVLIYFRTEALNFFQFIIPFFPSGKMSKTRINQNLIVASLPIIFIGGLAFMSGFAQILRDLQVIGLSTIVFGLALYFADIRSNEENLKVDNLSYKKSLIIGFFQIFAIIPGASRAGVVYTGSRVIGLNRIDAAKFSMLLSIPVIIMSAAIPIIEIMNDSISINFLYLFFGFIIAFITAYLSIGILLKWVKAHSMTPFVIYRIILGTIILIYFT
tara:strand:- start:291 stop:1088 length:798 start_codon:yes stop_codon:yes gene_type:complete